MSRQADVFTECTDLMYKSGNADEALAGFLRVLGQLCRADRTCIFEADGDVVSVTYEWSREGLSTTADNLKNIPKSVGTVWREMLDTEGRIEVDDIEIYSEKATELYKMLREQDVRCVVASPIVHHGKIEALIVMANPQKRIDDALQTVAVFVVAELVARNQEKEQAAHREKMEEALKAARAASEAKTKFLFNMSHDVRTPLNAVMGFLDMARRYINDRDRVIDCLNKMQTSGEQLVDMINNVLNISRIESGQIEIDKKPVSIGVGATELEVVFMPSMEKKHIFFETGARIIRDLYVVADMAHINQVIFNIMSNAIKYTPEGGKIVYSFEQLEDTADGKALFRWTISDSGIGMSQEFVDHIFERFAREHTTTECGVEGTGLGMSLVKELVDLMDGEIHVTSEIGKGTTVSFELPLEKTTIDEVMKCAPKKLSKAEEYTLVGKKVLVVEDNDMNREIELDILENAGMEAYEAADGVQAVTMLRENGPDFYDMVLMDIQMPRMNGYEATKAIRSMFGDSHLPIIGISANTFDTDKQQAKRAGMNEHIGKPLDMAVLKKTMIEILGLTTT